MCCLLVCHGAGGSRSWPRQTLTPWGCRGCTVLTSSPSSRWHTAAGAVQGRGLYQGCRAATSFWHRTARVMQVYYIASLCVPSTVAVGVSIHRKHGRQCFLRCCLSESEGTHHCTVYMHSCLLRLLYEENPFTLVLQVQGMGCVWSAPGGCAAVCAEESNWV